MSNYVRGLKRQQIIERWIHGHDDPDYEVFPTKKEGRYVVKKRVEPLQQNEEVNDDEEQNEEPEDENIEEQVNEEPKSKPKPKPPLKRTVKSKQITTPKPKASNTSDMTVGIEILEQLKLLGEEMKHQRKKKEQKEVIKQVVQKQLTKNPRKRKVIKEEYSDEEGSSSRGQSPYDGPSDLSACVKEPEHKEPVAQSAASVGSEPQSEPTPESPMFRSRIRNRI